MAERRTFVAPWASSHRHWAIGTITFPENDTPTGYLLYLKSSLTGDEPEDIRGYRAKHANQHLSQLGANPVV